MANGRLEKLVVLAYSTPDHAESSLVERFEAYVNPGELTLAYEMEYDSAQGSGTTGSRMDFKQVKPGDLTLNFFLDGTGANGVKIDVQEQVEQFQTVTGYNGDIHRPNWLKVAWGTLPGQALRAQERVHRLQALQGRRHAAAGDDQRRPSCDCGGGPDPRRAGAGLVARPDACARARGRRDAGRPRASASTAIRRSYVKVARANDLDSVRQLPAGTRVRFPPLAK